nr:hypothetical protein [Tanacetum cinerariifolium]
IVIPTVELVTLLVGTKPVIPPPSTNVATIGARITVQLQASISLPPEAEVEIILAMPTPPPSPLASLSPPSVEERLTRMASTQALINAVTTALPSPPLPPPLYIPPPIDRKDDVLEIEIPPRNRDTWVDPTEAVPKIAPTTLGERVDLLMEDRIAHQETILIVEEETYAAREAWAHLIGLTPCTSDPAIVAGYSYSDTTPGTDGRDSLTDGRHKKRDRGHAGRVVGTTKEVEES